ncbi:CocE/NonD family hydrolase [Sphingosinithalassobacter sp. CS137]|uniref:CocE/NonD family hydrolase n=1 Tax=Sphingosinithalassobacter sp. CS137 TaxID=2762748 RepID=UPI0021D33A6C|nr:CocE/NonD family hydrolase [Sphingosinithalassobacter sp. CS137]
MLNRLIGLCMAVALLAPAPAATAQEGDPQDFVRQSLYVPVRDGTRLAVNIYRPATAGEAADEPLPVIFVSTPYRARYRNADGEIVETGLSERLALSSLLRAGYVIAVADIRGKGASFGTRRGFQDRTEAQDSYDLVEWLARQPFSTGSVGMIGCSYLGGTTFQTATTAPPSLKAVFIGASELDKYEFVRRGGITAQFNTRPDEPAEVDLASIPVDADADGTLLRQAVAEHAGNTPMGPLWYGMPNRDSVSEYTGNAFWEEVAVYRYLDAIREAGIATYFWGNWHDEPTGQVILGAANLGGKFLAGPGDHCVPPPGFDFAGEVTRYFDHHLKGVANGIDREPRATYWVEGLDGEGRYVQSDELPGVQSRPVPWFLSDTADATGSSLAAAPGAAGRDDFTVDYDLPPAEYFAFWPRPMVEHGLGYTSAPLDASMTLIGSPVAHLTVTASDPDANLFVYLDQINAEGEAEVIAFGRLKLTHRKLSQAPYETLGLPWHSGLSEDMQTLAPSEEAPVSIALTPVSRVVPAGARLRFTVAGADPRQRNLQDTRIDPAPQITVLRGGRDASRIELPLAR